MTTKRKKTPGTRSTEPSKRPKRTRRKPEADRSILAADAAALFSEVEPGPPPSVAEPSTAAEAVVEAVAVEPSLRLSVTEADIVREAVVVEPPRSMPVQESDIVDEVVSAPCAMVHVPAAPPPPPRPRWAWRASLAALLLVATAVGLAHRRAPAPETPAPASPPVVAMSVPAEPPSAEEPLRALGHAAFSAGQKRVALRAYERALSRDQAAAVDPQLVSNLLACYGQRSTQPQAAALIVRFQIVDARTGLLALTRGGRTRGTRLGARYTLEKLRTDRPARLS